MPPTSAAPPLAIADPLLTSWERIWLPYFERTRRPRGHECAYCAGKITTKHSLKHPGIPTGRKPSCTK